MFTNLKIVRFLYLYPAILFLLNVITRSIFLISEEIGVEESLTIYIAQFNVNVLTGHAKSSNVLPLYEIILHYWIQVFGISPLSVRVLPMLPASVSPLALFYFCRTNFSIKVAIGASLLLTFSNMLLFYSHDCSAYSLLILLAITCVHLYFKIFIRGEDGIFKILLFIFVSALLINASYAGFYILFLQTLHTLIFKRHLFIQFTGALLAVILIYWPNLPLLYMYFSRSMFVQFVSFQTGFKNVFIIINTFSNHEILAWLCLSLLVVPIINRAVRYRGSNFKSDYLLIVLWLVIPVIPLLFIATDEPNLAAGPLLFVLPAYYIVLIFSIERLGLKPDYTKVLIAILILFFSMTVQLNPVKNNSNSKAVSFVKEQKNGETLVISGSFDQLLPFAYYYNRTYFANTNDHLKYHLTDSLLRSEGIYFCKGLTDYLKINEPGKTRTIYLESARENRSAAHRIFDDLNSKFKSHTIGPVNSTYTIHVFENPVFVN